MRRHSIAFSCTSTNAAVNPHAMCCQRVHYLQSWSLHSPRSLHRYLPICPSPWHLSPQMSFTHSVKWQNRFNEYTATKPKGDLLNVSKIFSNYEIFKRSIRAYTLLVVDGRKNATSDSATLLAGDLLFAKTCQATTY